jgi:hypothetical protein
MARSGILYGSTGTFKTTAIAHLARWIARKTGKSTLLLSSDGGGWEPCREEVLAGMIIPYHIEPGTIPLPQIRLCSKGYWPENPDEGDISKVNFVPVDWTKIGGIAVEGITSIGTMLMRHLADKNIRTGEEGTSRFTQPIRVNGDIQQESFAGSSKGHYGFTQNQLYSLVTNFQSLPVEYVLFTGHEKKFKEDGTTMMQYGISVPGQALTPLVPTWFGDCIHAQDYRVPVKLKVPSMTNPGEMVEEDTVEIRARYYFVKHPDPDTGLIFEAKPRVTHSKVDELKRVFPGGFFVPTTKHGFDLYLDAVDKLAGDAAASDELKGWRDKMDSKLGRGKAAPAPAPVTEITTAR